MAEVAGACRLQAPRMSAEKQALQLRVFLTLAERATPSIHASRFGCFSDYGELAALVKRVGAAPPSPKRKSKRKKRRRTKR